jgi:hypothetical protein
MRPLAFVVALAVVASVFASRRTLACGASGPGGVGVAGCSLAEHDEETRLRWRLGGGYAFTSTTIRLSGDRRADEQRHAAVATLDVRPTSRVTLQLGLGALIGGGLDLGSVHHDFDPGLAVVAGASWRVVDAEGARPFLLLGTQIAFSASTTHDRSIAGASAIGYEALDVRLGVAAGYTIARTLSTYALARAFGGPIFWRIAGEAVTGTDLYHYQLGAGLSVVVAKRFDVYVEGVPLGERAIAAGLGWSF